MYFTMSRIILYSLLTSIQIFFIRCQIDIDWEDHDKSSAKDENYRCGIKNYYKTSGKARIINGEATSSEKYPWLSQIEVDVPGQGVFFSSGGSIISNRIILTCLHCVCLDITIEWTNPNLKATCLYGTTNDIPLNQNRMENRVHYFIGSMTNVHGPTKYESKIKVYTYKYDPEWNIKNRNRFKNIGEGAFKYGDIAIVIDTSTNGLNLKQYSALPICLPTPKTYEIDDISKGIPVIMAGRGIRYDEKIDGTINPLLKKRITSCFTNEGLVRKKDLGYEGVQNKFLSCKGYYRKDMNTPNKDVCISLSNARVFQNGKSTFNAEKLKSISTRTTITFSPAFRGDKNFFTITLPQNDRCVDYWLKAEQALKDMKDKLGMEIANHIDFTSKPDRIAVLNSLVPISNNLDTKVVDTIYTLSKLNTRGVGVRCYNLEKLGQHGVCETEDDKYPWGFCSPSCSKSKSIKGWDYKQYEKMDARYHEKSPIFSEFRGFSLGIIMITRNKYS